MTRCARLLVLTAMLLATAIAASGQTAVTIDDLTAPTSPGFVLLDVSPTSVERPETPKAFTLNLLDKVAAAQGFPQNYAIEVAPYWMASHPALTFHEYQHPRVLQSLAQTAAVSIATVPLEGESAGADPIGTRLGLGARASVFNGRPNPRLEALVDELHAVDDEILDAVNAGRTIDPELRARARDAAAAVQAADAQRLGFFLAVAAGQTWAFPNDDVSRQRAERHAFWVTPSYRRRACSGDTCEATVDVIGVVRGLANREAGWVWDFGGRFVWRATRAFHASIETLQRSGGSSTPAGAASDDASNRTAGIVEYRIRQDVVVYGSFGRDFKKDTGVRPLVSFLGLNFGLGSKAIVKADAASVGGQK